MKTIIFRDIIIYKNETTRVQFETIIDYYSIL